MERNGSFTERVYAAVAAIPEGKVATYGQIAAAAGNPGAAREGRAETMPSAALQYNSNGWNPRV
ncbi:MAG: MGMT family protein [Bacteroidales bacterium]|nr:MGMT family protein [Bacteroidales bacterium]